MAAASGKKLRILYVHNSADIYGASRSLVRLVQSLDGARFEPVVMLPENGPLQDRLERGGVPVVIEPSLAIVDRFTSKVRLLFEKLPTSVYSLVRFIRDREVDLVHTNTGVIFSPGLAAKLANRPHVWHVRESFEEFSTPLWKGYRAYMTAVSDRIICVSTAVADQFVNRRKVEVIHNGFALEEFEVDQHELRKRFRAQYEIAETDFVVGCVGRIKWGRKGQEFLVQAAGMARDAGKPFVVLIVGTTSRGNEAHATRLQRLIGELNLADQVVFTGEVSDARPAYAASDVVVLPSAQPEPFAGVVMEAMCMSKPVIATALGGCIDQIDDGKTGYLVPPADARALTDKILLLRDDVALRTAMALAAREQVAARFSLSQMIKLLEAIYCDLARQ